MFGAGGRGGVAQDLAVVVDAGGVGEGVAGIGRDERVEVDRSVGADEIR
jgi:hypothetical protein